MSNVSPLRLTVEQACDELQISRAFLYKRIQSGRLKVQKDGTRTYLLRSELERYVASLQAAEVA
jgi:excisionase family DNA binding protein